MSNPTVRNVMTPVDLLSRKEVVKLTIRWERAIEWVMAIVFVARETLQGGRLMVGGTPLDAEGFECLPLRHPIPQEFLKDCIATGFLVDEGEDGLRLAKFEDWYKPPSKTAEAEAERSRARRAQAQATADRPQATADRPQATADRPQATADRPQATADRPQATADRPQATADRPQATESDRSDRTQPYPYPYPQPYPHPQPDQSSDQVAEVEEDDEEETEDTDVPSLQNQLSLDEKKKQHSLAHKLLQQLEPGGPSPNVMKEVGEFLSLPPPPDCKNVQIWGTRLLLALRHGVQTVSTGPGLSKIHCRPRVALKKAREWLADNKAATESAPDVRYVN